MLTNMHEFDRKIRFVTGVLIWVLYLTGSITGGFAHFLAVIGVLFVTTSIMNFCPYYIICNYATKKNSKLDTIFVIF